MSQKPAYSKEDSHIIVNYHYVEDPSKELSGIHPCSLKEFERQMQFLSSQYRMVSLKELADAVMKNSKERLCAVTFDDGLLDQYRYALPILDAYNISASFFIITGVLQGSIPSAHIVHLLLSHATSLTLVRESNNFFSSNYPKEKNLLIPLDRRITLTRKMRDDIPTANFKETINRLDEKIKLELLHHLLQRVTLNAADIGKALFMDEHMLRTLTERGHEIGCHGDGHYAFDVQDTAMAQADMERSKDILEDITKQPVISISYPHGGYTEAVGRVAHKVGFTHGVTIERRPLSRGDNRLALPRYDMKDIQDYLDANL